MATRGKGINGPRAVSTRTGEGWPSRSTGGLGKVVLLAFCIVPHTHQDRLGSPDTALMPRPTTLGESQLVV